MKSRFLYLSDKSPLSKYSELFLQNYLYLLTRSSHRVHVSTDFYELKGVGHCDQDLNLHINADQSSRFDQLMNVTGFSDLAPLMLRK